jgi:RNA polymerase sigma factor (sigma-70 family)
MLRRLPAMRGRDLAFGSYIFTATRNASYDLIEQRRRVDVSDSIPESATPLGGGAGGLGLDPGDPEDDPSRRQLLDSQRSEIREANQRIPERQREVLALRELEELSYDEIAEIMGMNRNSVAQLISRARLNLRAELRGAALESIPPGSSACSRALPLIALREDGELIDDDEAGWLGGHLADCRGCRLRVDAMQEAGASYRAWAPIAAAPWLFEATMAKAAEHFEADWSELIADRVERRAGHGLSSGSRRAGIAAIVATAVLLAALVAAGEIDDGERQATPPVAREADEPAESGTPLRATAKPRRTDGAPAATLPAEPQETSSDVPVVDAAPAAGGESSEAADRPPPSREARPGSGSPTGVDRGSGVSRPAAPETAPRPQPETPPAEPPVREPEPPVREPERPAPEGTGPPLPPGVGN